MKRAVYNCFMFNRDTASDEINAPFTVQTRKFAFDKVLLKKMLYNAVVSGFRQKVYTCSDEKGLVHYSFAIAKCHKFGFLKQGDYSIGPCWTRDDQRGKGLFGDMLNYIASAIIKENPQSKVYVLVRTENEKSMRGVAKANFVNVGVVKKTPWLKQYSAIYKE